MIIKNLVASGVQAVLKIHGFKKKGMNWMRRFEDLVQVVNLQKSQYGEQYYVNIGIYILSLSNDDKVDREIKETDCHLRLRADGEWVIENVKLRECLDFDGENFKLDDKLRLICLFTEYYIIQILSNLDSFYNVKTEFLLGHLSSAYISAELSSRLTEKN